MGAGDGELRDIGLVRKRTAVLGLHLSRTTVGAYGEAVTYLKKVRKILDGPGKPADWTAYLANLIELNKRKTRLVQMLNVLSEKPILSK